MSLHKCLMLCLWVFWISAITSVSARKYPSVDSNETSNEAIRETLISRQISPTSMPIARPINIMISAHLQHIFLMLDSPVPKLEVSLYYREHWNDVRYEFLRLTAFPRRSVTFSNEELHIWHPDTFFVNDIDSKPISRQAGLSFLRIFADGEIHSSVKEQRSIPCRFDWNRYPYDSQHCTIVLESYGYSTSDITYSLRTNPVTLEDTTFYHPEYQINTQVRAEIKNSTFAAGTFTRVELVVELQRNHKHFGEIFVAPMMLVILSLFALKLTDKLTLIVCIIGFLLTAFILLMVIVFNSFLQAKYSSVVTRYFVMCGFQLFLELFLVFLATFISPVTQCDAEAPINNRVRDTIVHRTKLYIMGPNNKTHRLMNFIFVLSFCFLLFWVILFWICVAPTY